MDGANDLREQAKQWRRIAERYTPGLARALCHAAASLDAQADQIEQIRNMPPAEVGDFDRPKSR
ncbi:MAG: hypothetical protein WDO24_07395 [Pseudomonadota bacterium]